MDKKINVTRTGYKLFEMNKDGKLFPLFIGKSEETPMNKWVHADNIPTKGFAARPGWHIGETCPDAPWLKSYDGTDLGYYKSRFAKGKRVWCEVEYNASINYDDEVQKLPKKCFVDKIPENGFYFFREVGKGTWVITSNIKITRILTEEERQEIMLKKGYDEKEAFKKYKETFEKKIRNSQSKKGDIINAA